MVDFPKNNAVRDVINELHQCLKRITDRGGSEVYERTLADNRLFRLLCNDPSRDPGEYAREMVAKYGYDMGGGLVVVKLKAYWLRRDDNRELLCRWAGSVADQFVQCLRTRSQADFRQLKELLSQVPEVFARDGEPMRYLKRFLSLMLYTRYPDLNAYGDAEKLETFGNTWGKYFFDEAIDVLGSYCQDEHAETVSETDVAKLELEQEKRKVRQLSAALERANTAMQDLETEFEERLEEEKAASLTEFFARLNSEKYGCILDELLNVRKGINELKKQNYEVPVEISGLFIVIVKLTQFVRDSHIDPIMKMNAIRTVKAEDVVSCDYDGTPFRDENEEKVVRVVSSGWMYVDKEVQIARPKLKEVTEIEDQR